MLKLITCTVCVEDSYANGEWKARGWKRSKEGSPQAVRTLIPVRKPAGKCLFERCKEHGLAAEIWLKSIDGVQHGALSLGNDLWKVARFLTLHCGNVAHDEF